MLIGISFDLKNLVSSFYLFACLEGDEGVLGSSQPLYSLPGTEQKRNKVLGLSASLLASRTAKLPRLLLGLGS